MTRAQKLASELEEQLVMAQVREQQTAEDLKKITEDRDTTMARLENQVAHVKKLAIKEFKSLDDF